MTTFYISSTFEDLKDYRGDARKLLRRRGHTVICMEDYGPDTRRPLDKCLQDVERCDVYIGIVAWRYGFIPNDDNPNQQSMTECEYRHASGLQPPKERLLFLLADKAPWQRDLIEEGDGAERLKEFRKHLSENHTVCFFKSRREFRRKVRKEVKRFSHARSFWEWLRDLLPDWPWYATAAAALGVVLLAASLGLAVHYWRLSPRERIDFLIAWHLLPPRFTAWDQGDYFDPPAEERADAEGCRAPNDNLWDYTPGQWCLDASDTLSVRGGNWGLWKKLGDASLYDFKASFVVVFRNGDKAAWVVRAQDDKCSGYVFELMRKRGPDNSIELYLNGWAQTCGGARVPLGTTPDNLLPIGEIYEDDYFIVVLTARENGFSHTVKIQNAKLKGRKRTWFTLPYPVDKLTDEENHFTHGTVGFFVPDKGGEILIDTFMLENPEPDPTPPQGD